MKLAFSIMVISIGLATYGCGGDSNSNPSASGNTTNRFVSNNTLDQNAVSKAQDNLDRSCLSAANCVVLPMIQSCDNGYAGISISTSAVEAYSIIAQDLANAKKQVPPIACPLYLAAPRCDGNQNSPSASSTCVATCVQNVCHARWQ